MKTKLKLRALQLREKGYSVKELHTKLGVSKGTISLWVRDVDLSEKAKRRLESLYTQGQLISQRVIKEKTRQKNKIADQFASKTMGNLNLSPEVKILLCAMIWWCEGGKALSNSVTFTNSDPDLIKSFLFLFREAFSPDEKKFRILLHLHDYHNEVELKNFWSKATKVSLGQFNRTHWKKSDHKFKKEGYKGCVKLSYYDVKSARILHAVAKRFMERYK